LVNEHRGESWDLADYVLSGTGASEAVVESESLTAIGPSHAVLVPLNRSTVYGSLLLAIQDGRAVRPRIEPGDPPPVYETWTEWTKGAREAARQRSCEGLGELLAGLFPALDLAWLSAATATAFTADEGLELELIIITDRDGGLPAPAVKRLASVFATTVPVVERTAGVENAAVERAVRQLTDPRTATPASLLPRLTHLALDATRSDWAAVYSPSDSKRLQLLSFDRLDAVPELETIDLLSATHIGARAYRQSTTFFLNDESSGLERLQPTPPGPQMAVPIGGATVKAGAISGVLLLGRTTMSGGSPYSQYDAALARNVAIRLSVLSEAEFLAAALDLVSSVSRATPPTVERAFDGSLGEDLGIGADVVLLMPTLQSIVDQISEHPQIDSVSIRVESTDRSELVRVAIAPAERRNDEYSRIAIGSKSSVVALCARTQQTIQIDNIDKSSVLKELGLEGVTVPKNSATGEPRPTKSELCVPISGYGRCVATLNIESSRKGVLQPIRSVAHVLAAVAASEITRVHRVLEAELLDVGIRLFGAAHTLARVSDQLRTAGPLSDVEREGMAETIRRSLSLAGEQGVGASVFDPHQGLVAVAPIVEAALAAVDAAELGSRRAVWVTPQPDPGLSVSERVGRALFMALTELLQNAFHYAPGDDLGRTYVQLKSDIEEGRLVLDVQNQFPRGLRLPLSALYTVPIASGGRLHLGAFGAGVAIRFVRGDIFVADHSDRHIRVRLAVPLKST
jgi:hypothetical protein